MSKHGIIFISCGQRTAKEIALGKKVVSVIKVTVYSSNMEPQIIENKVCEMNEFWLFLKLSG